MYILLFVLNAPYNYLGTYQDIHACTNAIREIYANKLNPSGQRDPQLYKTVDMYMKGSREFLCVKKG